MNGYKVDVPKTVVAKDFILGLAEKPTAAKRIAEAIGKPRKNIIKIRKNGEKLSDIDVYTCETDHGRIVIIPALGHLFTIVQNGKGWQYPVYDFRWAPYQESIRNRRRPPNKHEKRIEATVEAIRNLVDRASKLVIMTDYDQEGEVIGGVVFQELSKVHKLSDILRMRFSSLTKREVQNSFEELFSKKNHMDFGLYRRGLMRHYLDWLWGINLSRALMLALKQTSGRYQTLSTGRVQGPTLSFVAKREKEIEEFVPEAYYVIDAEMRKEGETYVLSHTPARFKSREEVETAVEGVNGGVVKSMERKGQTIKSPIPYNLSALQADAYRYFGFTPRRTLGLAERLYLAAVITYPRTSSESYPDDMDHAQVLAGLKRQKNYKNLAAKIEKRGRKRPNKGKKTDPAHPAIAPTGQAPTGLPDDARKLYGMIVRRYLSTFASDVKLERSTVRIESGNAKFYLSGTKVKSRGWWEFQPPASSKDVAIPEFQEGEEVVITKADIVQKFTNPPPRYNEASLLKAMEKAEIGTKATRADIIQALFNRKYIEGKPIVLTRLGKIIYEVLSDYSPKVVSVDLSREIERMGELIEETYNGGGSTFTLEKGILRGISILHSMLNDLQMSESEVGHMIAEQLHLQNRESVEMGSCPKCKSGTLMMIVNRTTRKRFLGCSNYFEDKSCDATYPLPPRGEIERMEELCPVDAMPQLKIRTSRRRFWMTCLNIDCEANVQRREEWERQRKERELQAQNS